jgi:hypothetical protein
MIVQEGASAAGLQVGATSDNKYIAPVVSVRIRK